MKFKKCPRCGIEKKVSSFHRNASRKDGRNTFCKKCKEQYRQDNIEKVIKYRKEHAEQIKANRKKWYKEHIEEIKKYDNTKARKSYWRKYKKEHAEEMSEKARIYNKKRTEERKRYYREHIEEIRKRQKERFKADINYRLSVNLRNRVSKFFKTNPKMGSAVRDLGCTVEFLKQYLESKFQEGMSWENYGHGLNKWNVDHIFPLSKFDLTDREQFLKACHYTNLQPLWHVDNMKKGNKI